jgi:hypothetical protein
MCVCSVFSQNSFFSWQYSVFSNSWQILKTEAGTKRNLRISLFGLWVCVLSVYKQKKPILFQPAPSRASIHNPGKFGAVAEGVRASVSPLGGSFCTRV